MLATVLAALLFSVARGSPDQCAAIQYAAAADAHKLGGKLPLAGFTRAVVEQSRYAILTPESRVYAGPPPGWQGSKVSAAAVITPALGAHFTMYLVEAPPKAEMPLATSYSNAPHLLERFLYVLRGRVDVANSTNGESISLRAGGYCYFAPNDPHLHTSVAAEGAAFILIDRIYAGIGVPQSVYGHECEVAKESCKGEMFELRRLLNPSDASHDFNIHIMDFKPGQYLNVKEIHYNQHGLLLLEGFGIYMLHSTYFPVSAGDVVYMGPFTPQWYGALGTERSRYFLYKDTNGDPLVNV